MKPRFSVIAHLPEGTNCEVQRTPSCGESKARGTSPAAPGSGSFSSENQSVVLAIAEQACARGPGSAPPRKAPPGSSKAAFPGHSSPEAPPAPGLVPRHGVRPPWSCAHRGGHRLQPTPRVREEPRRRRWAGKAGHGAGRGTRCAILRTQQTEVRLGDPWRQESGEWLLPFGVRKRVGRGHECIQLAETNGAAHVSRVCAWRGDTSINVFTKPGGDRARMQSCLKPPERPRGKALLLTTAPTGNDDVASSALSPTLPAERCRLPVPTQGRVATARASVGRLLPRRSVEGPWSENAGFPCTAPRLVPGHGPGHATRWPTSGVSGKRSLNKREVRVQERQLPRMSLVL